MHPGWKTYTLNPNAFAKVKRLQDDADLHELAQEISFLETAWFPKLFPITLMEVMAK